MPNSSYGPVSVAIYGGFEPDGDVMTKCKLTLLGESPNATVKLYKWIPDLGIEGRFIEYDSLTECNISESGDEVHIAGFSDQMQEQAGLTRENAGVRWVANTTGCQDC